MERRHLLALLAIGALAAPFPAKAQIINNFGIGTVRSGVTTGSSTTTSQEQTNTVSQTFGGSAYTSSGENIQSGGALGPGQTYTVARPGEPFQFSETWQPSGLVRVETTNRTVNSQTLTNSLSVFAEIQ